MIPNLFLSHLTSCNSWSLDIFGSSRWLVWAPFGLHLLFGCKLYIIIVIDAQFDFRPLWQFSMVESEPGSPIPVSGRSMWSKLKLFELSEFLHTWNHLDFESVILMHDFDALDLSVPTNGTLRFSRQNRIATRKSCALSWWVFVSGFWDFHRLPTGRKSFLNRQTVQITVGRSRIARRRN